MISVKKQIHPRRGSMQVNLKRESEIGNDKWLHSKTDSRENDEDEGDLCGPGRFRVCQIYACTPPPPLLASASPLLSNSTD